MPFPALTTPALKPRALKSRALKSRARTVFANALATGIAAYLLPLVPAAGQPAMRAQQPPADLALEGPLRLGDASVEWGGIVALDPASAIRNQAGHCGFRYRYSVANRGQGAAAAHVNRLRLEGGQVLAEDAVGAHAPGATQSMSGLLTLWSGEVLVHVELDAGQQVDDADRGNNLRRIRADVGEGCPDPRPGARPPIQPGGGPDPRSGLPVKTSSRDQEPAGPRARPPDSGPGSGAPRSIPPPTASRGATPQPSGTRAPPPQGRPAQQGRPAPGSTSKPIPEEALHCRPRLSAERTAALTRAGGLATATAAWEASALALHGPGFPWSSARDRNTDCSLGLGWSCTVSARPCRS